MPFTADAQKIALAMTPSLPSVEITGAVYPGEPAWTGPQECRAALGAWVSKIAREVGKHFDTHSERSAAEAFVRSHRLSIANAFERKLVLMDVVAELLRLFQIDRE